MATDNTPKESDKAKATRLRKEAACREIAAGRKSQGEIALEFDVSHQAVSKWMHRYEAQGNLIPFKRGRKKLRPLTELDKRQFFQEAVRLYAERGYPLGSKIPRRDRLRETDLNGPLTDITGQECSTAMAKRVTRELQIPLYFDPIPPFPEDHEFEGDVHTLRDPSEVAEEAKPKPLPNMVPVIEEDDDGEPIPKTAAEYAKWVEETKALLKERGVDYDPKKINLGGPQKGGHGVRTGKHAKAKRVSPRKNKRKKKRR